MKDQHTRTLAPVRRTVAPSGKTPRKKKRRLRRSVRTALILLAVFCVAVAIPLLFGGWKIEFEPGDGTETVSYPDAYTAPEVTARFSGAWLYREGRDLPVSCRGDVDDTRMGSYTLTYTASFLLWKGQCTREVIVADTTPPVIELVPETRESVFVLSRDDYTDPGFSAVDEVDGDLTDQVKCTEENGVVTYTVTDSAGNTATATRTLPAITVWSGKAEDIPDKTIFLTFDDGPGPYTNELLDILAKYNVKATFFVIKGNHTEEELDIITREAAEGHSIAVHSYTHNYNTVYASEAAYFKDVEAMNDIIFAKTGKRSTMIRFPGGSSNRTSAFNPGIMTRLTRAVEERGYSYFDWNVSTGDGAAVIETETVFNNVVNNVPKHKFSIVLQHDVKKNSVDAVERIIQWGLENGYTFLPLTPDCPGAHHRINN